VSELSLGGGVAGELGGRCRATVGGGDQGWPAMMLSWAVCEGWG
jgi:hypothetical protein